MLLSTLVNQKYQRSMADAFRVCVNVTSSAFVCECIDKVQYSHTQVTSHKTSSLLLVYSFKKKRSSTTESAIQVENWYPVWHL